MVGSRRRSAAGLRVVASVAAVVLGATALSAGMAGAVVEKGTAQPAKVLDGKSHGKAALQALQSKGLVDKVAELNGMTTAKLSAVLSSDESANLDETGRMFFVEPAFDAALAKKGLGTKAIAKANPGPAKAANPGPAPVLKPAPIAVKPGQDQSAARKAAGMPAKGASSAPAVGQGPYPYSQTFFLHSRPTSTKKMYLKFDGFTTVSGSSAWGSYTAAPYDTDSNPGSFSNAEQDTIQSVWQRIAEDYAPFDIDVTTQDPGLAAIDRTDSADVNYGTRVVFTSSAPGALCGSCGGVAYVGVIGYTGSSHEYYQPAWVFANYVPGAKNMAEAGSHEAGHNFGLSHDGCNVASASCGGGTGYYQGHGNWAPIMGVGYYEPIVQWSSGEYALANNTEDDKAIITTNAPYVADEDSNTLATARYLGVSYGQVQYGSGIITGTSDFDYFRFYAAEAGTMQLSVTPAPNSPNLDARLHLYNSAGAQIAFADPVSGQVSSDVASGLDASITYNLPTAGNYYIAVDDAQTDYTGDTGYTYYGSLGQYTVSVQMTTQTGESWWPVTPSRLLDTRPNAIAAGTTRNLTVTGVGGVPSNATAVSLNVAAVTPNLAGHLRVYPAGSPLPTASSLNFATNKNVPNAVKVKVGTSGQISIYAGNTTNVLVDVVGYYTHNAVWDQYTPVTPTRITNMTLAPLTTTNVTVAGAGGIPSTGPASGISSAVLNIGALYPNGSGHLRVWPTGSTMPNSSTNNFSASDGRMNLAIVRPGTSGQVSIYNGSSATVTLTVDTVGYFTWGGLGFVPMAPARTVDTRLGAPVAAGSYVEGTIRGFSGIPNSADVVAVAVNVASVSPSAAGSVDVGPGGATPGLPSFTHPSGQNVANLVIVPVGSNGNIRLVNNSTGTTHILADVVGYYTN